MDKEERGKHEKRLQWARQEALWMEAERRRQAEALAQQRRAKPQQAAMKQTKAEASTEAPAPKRTCSGRYFLSDEEDE
jgi:hypothetical protein